MNTTILKPKTSSTISSETSDASLVNRDSSWLDFNARVLDEARMSGNPLLERLKFIAIFSSNLDEFFMVRAAGMRHLLNFADRDHAAFQKTESRRMHRKLAGLLKKQYNLLYDGIIPALAHHGVSFTTFAALPLKERNRMRKFFTGEILPALTPLAVSPDQPFPLLNSGAIELAVSLRFPQSGKNCIAFVEIPELLDRFIMLPPAKPGGKKTFLLLEDLVAENLDELFPGGEILAKQIFRITRNMDFTIDPEDSEDLLHVLQDKLRQRSSGVPVRLEFSSATSDAKLQKYLINALQINPRFCYTLPGALHLKQFFALPGLIALPDLQEPPWEPLNPYFPSGADPFDVIAKRKNILLYHPYHSFDPIVKLLETAANDPAVVAIKQSLYRVSGNSPVVKALRRAAENGKQVTAVVEVKARFDEENNIAWAELLDLSGAHVVYGSAELKVHSKVLLIVRRENGSLRRYVHFGTGNYNDRTARLYSDISLLSCDEALADDAARLFNLLSSMGEPPAKWQAVSAAPFDLRQNLIRLIKKESALGKKGRIIAKMNSFSDPELIMLIQRAAAAGVNIDLIVRGICCLRPQPGVKNLRIISIIDRYLEHARIFYFGSEKHIYCASADWMPRNLDRRVEVMFPVYDPKLQKILLDVLEFQLKDTDKQRRLTVSGNYTVPPGNDFNGSRSQQLIYRYFSRKAAMPEE